MAAIKTNTRLRLAWTAIRAMLVLTVILGIAYPLAMTGISQLAMNDNANGSQVKLNGKAVGSDLIGQTWDLPLKKGQETADPDPKWFQGRASSGGYSMGASGASNLAANNPELLKAVKERRAQIAEFNRVAPADIPADALTASGSGLDPQISPDYADLQVERVAAARGLKADQVRRLVEQNTQGRTLGFLGDPRVNVLKLNVALQKLG